MTNSLLNWFRSKQKRSASAKTLPSAGKSDIEKPRVFARPALLLLTIAALALVMSAHLRSDRVALRLGDQSASEVRASRSVVYVDSAKTAQLQQAVVQSIRPVYDNDSAAAANASRIVEQIYDRIEAERARLDQHHLLRARALTQALKSSESSSLLPEPLLRRLLTVPPAALQKLRETTLRLVNEVEDREIRDNASDLHRAQAALNAAASEALPAPGDAAIVQAIAQQALRPNRLFNQRETQSARDAAARGVSPALERIVLGEKILSAGETVTQKHLDMLTALGLVDPRQEVTATAAISILAGIMVFVVIFYIYRTLPALFRDTRRLAMLSLIMMLSVVGLKVGATMLGISFSTWQSNYLGMMSVAAAGMLVSVLLDTHLAILLVALLSVQSGIIMNHEIRFTIMTLMSGLAGIASVGSLRCKINLPGITATLAAANLGMVWLMGLLFRDTLPELMAGSVWALVSAAFATFLFWFGILALEKPFGILTHTALLELSAFDRPLLRELCAVAPGTYAHSVMVGTLAEAGAQAINADALLCRVGGYYHDIGKMNRPDFFVENQRQDNVHGRLSPSLSALIITAHVRDGVTMAKEKRLPNEIRDIIAQHHGTTLIRYFYHRALADCECDGSVPPGLEERFRYPGPKPQSRESAIVMLADSVEAAVRCLDKPTQEAIEARIHDIVREKIEDGQFDDCPLNFRDIKRISTAFLHVLKAMMHGRIDYPRETPHTGSGQPMEVRRADLKPEPVIGTRLTATKDTEENLPAISELDTPVDLSAAHVRPLTVPEIYYSAEIPAAYQEEARSGEADYEPVITERTITAGGDCDAPASDPRLAVSRRYRRRGRKHFVDG